MLVFKDFSVWYNVGFKKRINVLENTEFMIREDSITGLIGLNGEGKTSLIKAILGLNKSANFELYLNSNKVFNTPINELLNLSYVPEIPSNETNFTVLEYLNLNKMLNRDTDDSTVKALVEEFQLSEYLHQKFSTVSKGTKKRVLIVAALLADWEFLILDEPFEGLDIVQRDVLKKLLIQECKERYILISSHEILEMNQFCSSIIKVDNHKTYDLKNV